MLHSRRFHIQGLSMCHNNNKLYAVYMWYISIYLSISNCLIYLYIYTQILFWLLSSTDEDLSTVGFGDLGAWDSQLRHPKLTYY